MIKCSGNKLNSVKCSFKFDNNNELFVIIEIIKYIIENKSDSDYLAMLVIKLTKNAGKIDTKTFTINNINAVLLINHIKKLTNAEYNIINKKCATYLHNNNSSEIESDVMCYAFYKAFNLDVNILKKKGRVIKNEKNIIDTNNVTINTEHKHLCAY